MGWRCLRLRQLARSIVPETSTKVVSIAKAASPGPKVGGVALTQIVPLSTLGPKASISFFDAFGRTGIVMMLVIVISIAWTCWLIVVTMDPNEAANLLMNTARFDDGMLWLIVNTEDTLVLTNTVSLIFISLGYAWVAIRMTLLRNRAMKRATISSGRMILSWRWLRWPGFRHTQQWWIDATSYTGPNRKLWVRASHLAKVNNPLTLVK